VRHASKRNYIVNLVGNVRHPKSLRELLRGKKTNTPPKGPPSRGGPLGQSCKPLEGNPRITIKKTLERTCLQPPQSQQKKKHQTVALKS
jgi:hypothetical protein